MRTSSKVMTVRLGLVALLMLASAMRGHAQQVASSGTPIASCTTPDPFASMGGGTCYNGGWLPPGMTMGPGSETTPEGLLPVLPLPTSGGSCDGPDPFAAMGGGNCYNGFWVPPGMTIGPGPVPEGLAPSPPAPSSAVNCSAPDPFAALGGGTCYNGGWLPPGMSPPSGASPPPPSAPISAGSTGGSAKAGAVCTTPDPFSTIGGGTCHDGGWLPPGMTAPTGGSSGSNGNQAATCISPDPFISIPGVFGVCVNGGWVPALRR